MDDLLGGRKDCLSCGGHGVPFELKRVTENDYVEYRCGKCGFRFLSGIVTTDGQPGQSPISPPRSLDSLVLPSDMNWQHAEVWWTNGHVVGAIHGRAITGTENLLERVRKVQSIYEDN